MVRFSLFSGIALALLLAASAAHAQVLEQNTERSGATYQQVSVGQAGANACWSRCAADPQCKAWTWQRPGIAGTQGMCSLKTAVTPARYSPCCVSGISKRLERQIELALQKPAANTPTKTKENILAKSPIPARYPAKPRVNKVTRYSLPAHRAARPSVNKITPPVTNNPTSDIHLTGE
ncbi:MAG: PAN domain-containing protein [Robiginitomaculum sp.]|nr:PAN domain-containing protein [Robiginitomaculum sp.]